MLLRNRKKEVSRHSLMTSMTMLTPNKIRAFYNFSKTVRNLQRNFLH